MSREHGTRTKYAHDRCRCLPCRMANSRYETARQAARRMPWRVHSVGGGRLWIVRSADTREIAVRTHDPLEAAVRRDELNATFRRVADLREPLWASRGTVGTVRRHLAALAACGIGLHQVARLARLSRQRLQEIARGRGLRPDRPRRRRLKQATAERILAVMTTGAAPGARVPAAETWRIVGELLAAGWTKGRIAQALGAERAALQLGRDRVLRRNADAVRVLHDDLWPELAGLREVCTCAAFARRRRAAA